MPEENSLHESYQQNGQMHQLQSDQPHRTETFLRRRVRSIRMRVVIFIAFLWRCIGISGWICSSVFWIVIITIFNTTMLHPLIRWAQRKDRVFLEVPLMDIKAEKIDLTATSLKFQGQSGDKKYSFELDLFEQIDTEESKWTKTGFHLLFVLQKKNAEAAFWPRITKEKVKNQYIQIDWSKWVDEDEEDQDPNKGLGGMDPSQMQGFPGMGGMGGMPGMGGMGGMPGMGGMGGMPGMGGMGMGDEDDEEGNLDDLEKEEQLQPKKEAPKEE